MENYVVVRAKGQWENLRERKGRERTPIKSIDPVGNE